VGQALKHIILEVYYNMYTSQLEDCLLQYTNSSALKILMHLKQTYAFINPMQLAENYNKMTSPINFQDPIETLFKRIEDGVHYANDGMQPYMEAQYVNIAFLLILNTGEIPDACRDWQSHTPVNQTWASTNSGNIKRAYTVETITPDGQDDWKQHVQTHVSNKLVMLPDKPKSNGARQALNGVMCNNIKLNFIFYFNCACAELI
jgi:hypothetical protein